MLDRLYLSLIPSLVYKPGIQTEQTADLNFSYPAPAKLDPSLLKEPRVIQGVPRINTVNARSRKPIPSMLGPKARANELSQSPPT